MRGNDALGAPRLHTTSEREERELFFCANG